MRYDNRVVELMSANYAEYTTVDLDLDGRTDIIVYGQIQRSATELLSCTGTATSKWSGRQRRGSPQAQSLSGVLHRYGGYADTPAVFVASTFEEDGLVTDVFAMRDGVFSQHHLSPTVEPTFRRCAVTVVYATDIDSDGIIEMPRLEKLPSSARKDE